MPAENPISIPIYFKVEHGSSEGLVVWAKARNAGVHSSITNGAQESAAAVTATLSPSKPVDVVLITVLAWDKTQSDCVPANTNTLKVIGSVAVEITKKSTKSSKTELEQYTFSPSKQCFVKLSIPVGATATDCSTAIANDIAAASQSAVKDFRKWLSAEKLTFAAGSQPYFQPTMVEADWVFGNFVSVPATGGWPQLQRLHFNARPCWANASAMACSLLGIELPQIELIVAETVSGGTTQPNVDRVLTTLVVLTLTAFAGAYPLLPEFVDDRTLGAMKLGTNRDCDDMAITVVAAFNFLVQCAEMQALPVFAQDLKGTFDTILLQFMLDKYKTAAAIVCRADPTVATADSDAVGHNLTGHVYAILSTAAADASNNVDGLVRGATVVEATRFSSPYCQPLDSEDFYIRNTRVFKRATYVVGEKDIQHVKPLMPEQYVQNIAAYTARATYAIVLDSGSATTIGVSGTHMNTLDQSVRALRVPVSMPSQYKHNDVAHTFNLADVDAAIAKYAWWQQLGFSAVCKPPCLETKDWTHLVERNMLQNSAISKHTVAVTCDHHQFVFCIIDPRTNTVVSND